jgi:hypothetical protein
MEKTFATFWNISKSGNKETLQTSVRLAQTKYLPGTVILVSKLESFLDS